jgi:hypothetical protein
MLEDVVTLWMNRLIGPKWRAFAAGDENPKPRGLWPWAEAQGAEPSTPEPFATEGDNRRL